MQLYFPYRIEKVKKLLDKKARLGTQRKKLPPEDQAELDELCCVSYDTAIGLAERGLTCFELKYIKNFWIKGTRLKLSVAISDIVFASGGSRFDARTRHFDSVLGISGIS